jgi:cytochrome c-type biogenesis protein CcsB
VAYLESISLLIAVVILVIGFLLPIISFWAGKKMFGTSTSNTQQDAATASFNSIGYTWVTVLGLGLVSITISIISRWIQTGHGPFSNMYEFAVAFSWGIVIMSLFFLWRYRTTFIGIMGTALALAMLGFAMSLPSRAVPLVPALQQSVLLSVHVASAVIAYGALTVGFSSAVVYMVARKGNVSWLPKLEVLDSISYHSVIIGFPFLTLTIILGAVWASIAWGRPWGWDPKETASLVTWLIFAAYLHARLMRHWKGTRSALLLIIGFAAILFTFFGNYIFSGLHSYG